MKQVKRIPRNEVKRRALKRLEATRTDTPEARNDARKVIQNWIKDVKQRKQTEAQNAQCLLIH